MTSSDEVVGDPQPPRGSLAAQRHDEQRMLRPHLRFIRIAVLVSCLLPFGVLAFNVARVYLHFADTCRWGDLGFKFGTLLATCLPIVWLVLFFPRRWTE